MPLTIDEKKDIMQRIIDDQPRRRQIAIAGGILLH